MGSLPRDTELKTFLVCGMTGVGKSTFINKVTGAKLSVSHGTDSDTVDVIETDIPLVKSGGEYIQLVDTPGFGDSRESSETVVLRRITTWLVARYMSKLPVTGVLFFRPISNVRVDRLEKALINMFKDLCGKDCLDHIVLVTTRWTDNSAGPNEERESELASREDYFGSDGEKKVHLRRLQENYTTQDALDLVKSLAGMSSVTLQIQREVADENMTLGETEAGQRIGADLEEKLAGLEERAKKAHEHATASMRKLKEAEEATARMEKEKAEAARRAKEAEEAARAAEREAQAAKARAERERIEAEERARKAEAEARAAQEAARRAEQQRIEEENRMRKAAEEARRAEQRAARDRAEAARLQEAVRQAQMRRDDSGGCLVM